VIDLGFTDEQVALRAAALDLFGRGEAITRARAAEPRGFDPELWSKLVNGGFVTMGVAEENGGGSAGALELAILAEEYGRALAPVPLVEALVAAELIDHTPSRPGLLRSIVEGKALPTVILTPLASSGQVTVPAGAVADVAVALRGDRLVAVHRPDTAATKVMENLADLPVSLWDLSAVDEEVLGSGDPAVKLFRDAVTEWKLLTAAALNGLREHALQIGVDYVKERHAFGVPLGWFQAVQHRFADDAAAGEGTRLLTYQAAWARSLSRPTAAALASMAFVHGAETAFRTCRTSLQFHGGYGYTLEYDIQLFLRRAKAWPLQAGPLRLAYEDLARELFGPIGVD
jgi:alkylation response protein AidB-like acyl-CoA dehydrogenase